jgi:hypothetical protein
MDVYQRRRLVALSALAGVFILIVLLIRSCGGDDSETPETLAGGATGATGLAGAALSQEQYIAQGDEICRSVNTSISEIDAGDANAAAEERGTDIASELSQLQSLGAPTDGQDELDEFLQALQDQVSSYEKRSLAVERGDDSAVQELDARIAEAEDAAAQAARQFGFEACGDFSATGDGGGAGGGGGGGGEETTTPTDAAAAGTVTPTVPVPTTPAPTTTTPVAPPPADTGTAAPDTGTAPPADTGTGGTGGGTGDTGGVTP